MLTSDPKTQWLIKAIVFSPKSMAQPGGCSVLGGVPSQAALLTLPGLPPASQPGPDSWAGSAPRALVPQQASSDSIPGWQASPDLEQACVLLARAILCPPPAPGGGWPGTEAGQGLHLSVGEQRCPIAKGTWVRGVVEKGAFLPERPTEAAERGPPSPCPIRCKAPVKNYKANTAGPVSQLLEQKLIILSREK